MTTDKLNQLLALASADDRICPVPILWDKFWTLIGRPSQTRPLILAGWAFSSDRDKRECFQAQIRYAADHGMLDQAEAFIHGLRPDEWHTCSPSGVDWNYGDAIAEDERNRDKSSD